MTTADGDRNLLFGVLALQMDFISRDALIKAMQSWAAEKTKQLGQILTEQGALSAARCALLEPLVEEHVRQHGGAEQSLAAVSAVASLRQTIEHIAGPESDAGAQAAQIEGFVHTLKQASGPERRPTSATAQSLNRRSVPPVRSACASASCGPTPRAAWAKCPWLATKNCTGTWRSKRSMRGMPTTTRAVPFSSRGGNHRGAGTSGRRAGLRAGEVRGRPALLRHAFH